MPVMIKLFGSTKSKINKDKNDKNAPHLEITEVVLLHSNIVNNSYQQNSRVLYTFVLNKSITRYFTNYIFKNFGFRIFIY